MDYRIEVNQERSPGTINTHFNHILQKLDAENVHQAIALGFIKGILKCRDKLPMLAIVFGTAFTVVGGVLPSSSYASTGEAPLQQPINRVRVRGGGSRVSSPSVTRLAGRIRRKEGGNG